MGSKNHIRMNITETNWIGDLKTSIKIKQNWAKFSLRVDQNWGVGASFIPQDPGPN
jgi:uncharacterized protein involved in high-affinity Fe2+ transport